MKEYDIVELLVDRSRYERAGVKKGMFGVIMSEDKVGDDLWQVIFTKFYTGEDFADICVKESDLKVWDQFPMDRVLPEQIGSNDDSDDN